MPRPFDSSPRGPRHGAANLTTLRIRRSPSANPPPRLPPPTTHRQRGEYAPHSRLPRAHPPSIRQASSPKGPRSQDAPPCPEDGRRDVGRGGGVREELGGEIPRSGSVGTYRVQSTREGDASRTGLRRGTCCRGRRVAREGSPRGRR
ncbi:uncharacterized protein A4U43_C01F11410 [Asparagus officinalis]|uniref:Uncharacterized protein n=1 Tax=Asparagus officinalis TaxID=4686 RepID=A0A5P1FNJ1_ASPOF|nr:uncharacterized protein A4U43_C01F11410 [Asparagus officinalis]